MKGFEFDLLCPDFLFPLPYNAIQFREVDPPVVQKRMGRCAAKWAGFSRLQRASVRVEPANGVALTDLPFQRLQA